MPFSKARLFYESDFLVMKALSNIEPGQQIFNDYGPLPRSDLLRRYGYLTPSYAQYDVVEISLGLITATIARMKTLSPSVVERRVCLPNLCIEE